MPRNVRRRVDRVRMAVREIFMERWQNVLEQAFREELEGEEIRLLIHVLLGALTFVSGDDLSEEHCPRLNVSEDSPEDWSPGEGVQLGTSTAAWTRRVQSASFQAATTRCRVSAVPGTGIIYGERECPALLCYCRWHARGGERTSRALGSARETCASSTSSVRMASPS